MSVAVRVSAVAFVLGLSLAGPQAAGIATADSSPSASAGSSDTRGSVGHAKSSAASRGESTRVARPAGDSADLNDGNDAAVDPARRPARLRLESDSRVTSRIAVASGHREAAIPEATAEVPSPADVPVVAAVNVPEVVGALPAAARLNSGCKNCWIHLPVQPGTLIQKVSVAVEQAMDNVGRWLSSLPANPITDFLSGALWMIRRNVFPAGAGVGMWGSAACVATKDCSGVDLQGADFSRQDLQDVNLSGANLNGTQFNWTDLSRADFTGATINRHTSFYEANLFNTTLKGLDLSYTDFRGMNLYGADLTDTNLSYSDLRGANLRSAVLVRANLDDTLFDNANLLFADLTDASLIRAYFLSADLTNATLTGANLTWAELPWANLTGANIHGANLYGVRWFETTCPNGSVSSTGCSAAR